MRPAVRHATFARESEPLEVPQYWRCIACRTPRQYGIGEPADRRPVSIQCEGACGGAITKHIYARTEAS